LQGFNYKRKEKTMDNSICTTCEKRLDCSVNDDDVFVDDITGTIVDCRQYKQRKQKYLIAAYNADDVSLIHQMYTYELPEEMKAALDSEKDKIDYEQIVNLYKSICPDLSKPRALTSTRRQNIRNCKKQLEKLNITFEEYFKKVNTCLFLHGKNSRQWKANFDFVIKPSNLLKIIEGAYDNGQAPKKGSITSAPTYDIRKIAADARNNTEIKY